MNLLTSFLLMGVITVVVCQKYTDRYDDIDVDEIVGNKRLLGAYIKCLLDKGRCTAEGKELKIHVKDAIQSACSKCTEVQRGMARKVVKHIKENEKPSWEQLKNYYDPGNKFQPIYEEFLAGED